MITTMVRPDGTIRAGRSTTYMVLVAGETVLLGIIEEVTERYPDEAKPDADTFPLIRHLPEQRQPLRAIDILGRTVLYVPVGMRSRTPVGAG